MNAELADRSGHSFQADCIIKSCSYAVKAGCQLALMKDNLSFIVRSSETKIKGLISVSGYTALPYVCKTFVQPLEV